MNEFDWNQETAGDVNDLALQLVGRLLLRLTDDLRVWTQDYVWMASIVSARKLPLLLSGSFIKFGIVGATGLVVNIGIFGLLLDLEVSKYYASPVAIELSIIWNFLLNNHWTFKSRQTGSAISTRGAKFHSVSFIALALSYSTFLLLSRLLPNASPLVHQFLSVIPASLVNYLLNSRWTFRARSAEQD